MTRMLVVHTADNPKFTILEFHVVILGKIVFMIVIAVDDRPVQEFMQPYNNGKIDQDSIVFMIFTAVDCIMIC